MKTTFTTTYKFYSYDEANYFHYKRRFMRTFRHVLEERMPQDLEVSIANLEFTVEDRPIVTLEGPNEDDLIFTKNALKELVGEMTPAQGVNVGDIMFGQLKEVGNVGFGVFVDVGITEPKKDALLPLHYLRDELVGGETLSLTDISNLYGLMSNLPVEVEIVGKKEKKAGDYEFECKFSEFQMDRFRIWVEDRFEIVLSAGAARQALKKTIAKRGHTQDVWEVQRLGPLEMAVPCKRGTSAPGIISHIGKFLPEARFSAIRPQRVKKYWPE